MNICITDSSAQNFMGLFNTIIPSVLSNGSLTANEAIKELYNKAFETLSENSDVDSLRLKEVILQHLGIGVVMMNKEINSSPLLLSNNYVKDLSEIGIRISNYLNQDNSELQKMFDYLGSIIEKGKQVVPEKENIRYNAISLEWARITTQLSLFSEKIGYKGNVTAEEKKYHEEVINEILSNPSNKIEFKLVRGFEILDKDNYAIVNEIKANDYVLIPTANKSDYIYKSKTPVFTFKQFEKELQETKKAKVESLYFLEKKNNENIMIEDVQKIVNKSLKEYLSLIEQAKANYDSGENVFFKINYDDSNKGFVEFNRNKITNANEIKNISSANVIGEQSANLWSYRLDVGAKKTIALFEKGWISQSDKSFETLLHLIKNENPLLVTEGTDKVWSQNNAKTEIAKEIRRFFPIGNIYASIDLENKTVNLFDKVISFEDLTIDDLKAASKNRSFDPIVSDEALKRNENIQVLNTVNEVIELGQWYKDSKGNVREAVGIKKGHGSNSRVVNTQVRKIIGLSDGKVIISERIPFSQTVLENTYVSVELNSNGELKGAGQYITFFPKTNIKKSETRKKFFSAEIKKQLATPFENRSAEEWFNNNPLSKVIELLYKDEYSEYGPQFLASYLDKVITMYSASEGVLLYHEAFHGFWNGILSSSERKEITNSLKSLNGSFKVTVNGKSKSINFSEATSLELEEYLAEEFRMYATKKSTDLTEKNSKIKSLFDKIFKAIVDFFKGSSYSDMISLGKSQSLVNGIFKDLYFGNFSTANFKTESSIDEKFASFEKNENSLSIQETDLFLESVNSITSFVLAEAFSHHNTNENIQESLGILNEMISLDPNSLEYKTLQEELELHNSTLPSGLNYDLFKSIDNLKMVSNFIKETFKDKLQFFNERLNQEPNNTFVQYQVDFLEKITQDNFFGSVENIENYLNEEIPSTLLSLFFKNNPFYILSSKDVEEKIAERNKVEEENESALTDESQDEVFQIGADQYNSKIHELDALEEQTKFILSSVPMHSMNGIGNVMINSLGFPKLRNLSEMNYKVMTVLMNSIDALEMNSKLKNAAEGNNLIAGDKEIAHIYKLLGDLESSNSNKELWSDFIQSFNKYYNKSISVIVTKVNDYETQETGEFDEETGEAIREQVLKNSTINMHTGQIGNDIQFIKQQWQAQFNYMLENGSPYVEIDEQGNKYFDLAYLIKDYTEVIDYKHRPKNYNGDGQGLVSNTIGLNASNYINKSAKAVWDAFNFLNEMGITIVPDPRIAQAFMFGDSNAKVESGTPDYFLSHLINRKEKLVSRRFNDDNTRTKDDNSMRIYNFNDLFSEFLYVDNYNQVQKSNQENALTNLMKLHYTYSNESGTYMSFTADGNKSNQMSYHSSLNNMAAIVNSSNNYFDLISIPGFEHFDIENNIQAQGYSWLTAMFNLQDPKSKIYGVRNKKITIDVKSISGSKLIEQDNYSNGTSYSNDIGVSVRNSDEITKYLSDIQLTLDGLQETPRAEAKSTSLTVSGYLFKRSTSEVRGGTTLALNYREANELMNDNYNGSHLTDLFFDTLAIELLRFKEIENINLEEELLFDAAYLNRANNFQFFDDVLTDDFKQQLRDLKINSIQDLEKAFNDNLKLQEKFESSLRDYFIKKLDTLETNKFEISYPQILINKAKLKGVKENESVTTSRMLLTFLINNVVNNLNYSNMFLLDFANYNVEGEDFHKRIAGLISTGKGFRFDNVWLEQIKSDSFLTATEYLKRNNKTIERSLLNYDGYIKTAIIKEKETVSNYSEYYKDYLGIDTKSYNEIDEADGQGWISFDMYRILSRSSNEWSQAQENLYQKIAKGESILSDDIKTTFPVRKFQYYGPILGTSENVKLSLMGFHKYSLAPLVPSVIKGTPLEKLHDKMMEQGIGYVTMKSGSKLGTVTPITFENGKYVSQQNVFYDNERNVNEDLILTPNIIHARYLKNQLYLAEGYKGYVTLPTQITKIDLIGLFDNGIPTDFNGDKNSWNKLSDLEKRASSKHYDWYARYNNVFNKQMPKILKEELLNDLGLTYNPDTKLYEGDDSKLIDYIKATLLDKDLLEEEIVSIIDPNTGKLIEDLSFSVHAAAIEKLLTILVDKRLRKLKINGEALVQVSGTMYESMGVEAVEGLDGKIRYGSNQLRFYHALDKDGNPVTDKSKSDDAVKVSSMEVIISLQGSYKSLLNLKHSDGKKIAVYNNKVLDYDISLQRLNEMMDDENFRKENEKILTFVGVRIPTQGPNSLSIPTVRKFLPEYAGPVIILPSEIVAQAGSDFDIDKLFSMMKNLTVIGNKVEEIKYMPDVKENVPELKQLYKNYSKQINELRQSLNNTYDLRNSTFEKAIEITENIKSAVMKELNTTQDLYAQRKELYGYINAAENKLWIFKESSLDERMRLLDSYNSNLVILNEVIEQQENRIKQDLSEELGFEKIEDFFKENDLDVEKNLKSINELKALKEETLRKINGKSIKGLENELIDLLIERGTMLSNFKDLVTANTTVDTKGMANVILQERNSNPLESEYNKREKINSKSNKISPTEAMMYEYNLYKHQENFVGMDSLGIAAVTSTFQAMFTVMDGTLQQNEPSEDKAFNQAREMLLNYRNASSEEKNKFNQTAIIQAKEIVSNYLQKTLLLKANVNEEGLNYFGGTKSTDGKNISDLISQMINGYVDVAKDAWVFLIEGNKENTPVLLTMIMLGVPFKDAVRMSVHPLIRKYTSYKKMFKGPYANMNDEVSIIQSGNIKARALKEMDYYKNKFFPGLSYNEINNLNVEIFESDSLENLSKNSIDNITARDIELFAQYLHVEKISEEMTTVTNLTKFDTTKMSTVNDVKKRIDDTEFYRKKNINQKFLGNKFIDYMQNDSIISSKNNDMFLAHLFDKQFKARNNEVLTDLSLRIRKKDIPKGFDISNVRTHFKNDFFWFLYQNSVYSGDTVSIVSTSGQPDVYQYKKHSSSEIKVEDGVIYYNPLSSLTNEFLKEDYKYVRKYFIDSVAPNYNQIKLFIAFKLTYEKLLSENLNLPIEKFNEKFFLFDRRGYSLRDNFSSDEPYKRIILQRAALFLSKNPNAMFDSEIGIVTLVNNLKSQYPELNYYGLISDMRFDYRKSGKGSALKGKYNIFYPNLNSDPNILKRYKENLKELSNHQSEWVRQIFNVNSFTHIALMQTGQSRNVKNDFVRIGNPRHLQNELFNSKVYSKISNTLEQAEILRKSNLKNNVKSPNNYLILSQYFDMFSKVLSTGKYLSRYSGINYIVSELDFVSTVNETSDVLDIKVTFVPTEQAKYKSQNFIEAYQNSELESFVKNLSFEGPSFVLLQDEKIIMPDEDTQAYLDKLFNQYLNIDNTGKNPKLIKRVSFNKLESALDLAPIIDVVSSTNAQKRFSVMAANANKAVGIKTNFLATSFKSSVSNLIDAIKSDKILSKNFNNKDFSENDIVWLFGDNSVVEESYSGYSKKEHEDRIASEFEKNKKVLDNIISSKATILVSPIEGFDKNAFEYLLENNYVNRTIYKDGIKYYELIHYSKTFFTETSYIDFNNPLGVVISKIRKQYGNEFKKVSNDKKLEYLRQLFVKVVNSDSRIINGRKFSSFIREEVLRLRDNIEIGLGDFNEHFEQMLLEYSKDLKVLQERKGNKFKAYGDQLSNVETKSITFDMLEEFTSADRENILNNLMKNFPKAFKSKVELISRINDSLKKDYKTSLEKLIEMKNC